STSTSAIQPGPVMMGKSAIVTMARREWERAARPRAATSKDAVISGRTLAPSGSHPGMHGARPAVLAMMGATTGPWPTQPGRDRAAAQSGGAWRVAGAAAVCGGDRHAKLGNTPDVPPGPVGLSCMRRHQARHAETRWQRVPGPGTESLEPVVAMDAWRQLVPQVGTAARAVQTTFSTGAINDPPGHPRRAGARTAEYAAGRSRG